MSPSTQKQTKEHKPAKVDKWDSAAVKNALDDALKKMMSDEFNGEEDHTLMNGRLAISAIGVSFSLFAVAWDYLHPFPESRPILITCVLSYFVMMCILTVYIMYKEKGIFLVSIQKDKAGIDAPNVWRFTSKQKRFDHMYELKIEMTAGSDGSKRETTMKRSVTDFFDEKGTLREDLFVPVIKQLCSSLDKEKKTK